MQPETSTRGSKKLLEQFKTGAPISHEEVKAAVAAPAGSEYKLLDWHVRGIPPVYWEVEAAFQVDPQQLGAAVTHFAANASIRNINILINGIPKPDVAQLNVISELRSE